MANRSWSTLHRAGLASEYWKQYYDADEVDELLNSTVSTMLVSNAYPIHVRLYPRSVEAPTVLIANSMLGYGLSQARWQLPFFRAGFNVLQFDFPGLGQSGGPRGGCTVGDFLRSWSDAVSYARETFDGPLFAMGIAEDGVACYHAVANDPRVSAISVHALFDYGEPEGVHWMGPAALVRVMSVATRLIGAVRPTLAVSGEKSVPWEDVFAGPGDEAQSKILERDPLSLRQVEFRMSSSVMRRRTASVAFEQCRTPVQVIASTHNRLWPYEMVKRNFERLGGPKELVTLEGKPMWEFNREFCDAYCAYAVAWFQRQGAEPYDAIVATSAKR